MRIRIVLLVFIVAMGLAMGATGLLAQPHPSARGYASMVYDWETGIAYLLGGTKKVGWYYTIYDVWSFNTLTQRWTQLFSDPNGTFFNAFQAEAMALDPRSKKILIYSNFVVPYTGVETWIYDIRSNTFENVTSGTEPPSRWGARMVYDTESRRAILFGGSDNYTSETKNETWAYDFKTNTWANLYPAVSPPPHHYGAMVYHPLADRVVLFGGYDIYPDTVRNETWAYDYNTNTWVDLHPDSAPSPRLYHTLAWDALSKRIILFGGVSYPYEPVLGDTWAFNIKQNTWTQLTPSVSPSARAWHVMAGTWRGVLLFGGGPKHWRFTNDDTWIYDSHSNQWVKIGH